MSDCEEGLKCIAGGQELGLGWGGGGTEGGREHTEGVRSFNLLFSFRFLLRKLRIMVDLELECRKAKGGPGGRVGLGGGGMGLEGSTGGGGTGMRGFMRVGFDSGVGGGRGGGHGRDRREESSEGLVKLEG